MWTRSERSPTRPSSSWTRCRARRSRACCTSAMPGDSPAAFVQTPRLPSHIGKSCGAEPRGRDGSAALARSARRSFCLTTFRLSCRCCTTAVPGDASPAAFVQTPRCPSQIGKSCGAVPGGRGFSFAAALAFTAARRAAVGIVSRSNRNTPGAQRVLRKAESKLNAKRT